MTRSPAERSQHPAQPGMVDDGSHRFPLSGLVARSRIDEPALEALPSRSGVDRSRIARSLFTTVPVLLVGSLAIATMNLSGALDTGTPKRPHDPKSDTSDLGKLIRGALASSSKAAAASTTDAASEATVDNSVNAEATISTAAIPATYTVKGGDTVSGIAVKHGLSTASVLALNGLSWKSVIFPGQVLRLTKKTATVKAPSKSTAVSGTYTIKKGDTISGIAKKFDVTTKALLTANKLKTTSVIYAGHTLKIPGKTAVATPPVKTPPVVVTTPPVTAPSAPSTTSGSYTIRTGDTITSIAKKFGVTVQAILTANKLTASSIIYAGKTLLIPGLAPASVGDQTTPLSPTMKANALTIISIGKKLGVTDYGIVIALAAAAQESGLQNLSSGDRDSVGLFQQRPSTGWGTKAQLLDTAYATRLFFGGPSNPNKGKTRGLLDIAGWQSMTLTKAAQAVQISAYPNAYAKWELSARAWYTALK